MEKIPVEANGYESLNDMQIKQLIRIARLELEKPIEGCKTLVFGLGDMATGLCDALKSKGADAKAVRTVAQLQEDDEQFELALILDPIPHRVLENLMLEHGVAIDANPQRSNEWIMHDKSLGFKRIRVLSIISR